MTAFVGKFNDQLRGLWIVHSVLGSDTDRPILWAPGNGTEDTRRRVSPTELGDSPVTGRVLQHLAAARLVTIATPAAVAADSIVS